MTSDTSFGPDQMEEGVHAWTSPCNPDPLKPGVKLMAGCNSAGVGVTSVSLPVVNSYNVSKTCDKGVKGRRIAATLLQTWTVQPGMEPFCLGVVCVGFPPVFVCAK